MHWILVGASLFASNIGSGHFIGLAGSGAASGVAIAGFELNAAFILLLLGWFFVPVYLASGVFTMPEYLHKRFGGQRIRIYLSVLALALYVFTKISADLYAGAIFINQSIRLDLYPSIMVLLVIAAIFTIAGGLTAVIWTDFVQTILMVLGALALSILSIIEVGGYSNLISEFKRKQPNVSFVGYDSENKSCSEHPDNFMNLLRSPSDPELPWTGMIFGSYVSAIWYWCADQVIVQRTLSAKNISHVKGGCIFAAYLKFLPMFLLVLPGMASSVLFSDEVSCSNPEVCKEICGSELGCSNIAYPKLVLHLMPAGARGLMMSVMLASLMSSLTSIFNSSSTIFTIDIWTRIRRKANEMELLIVGRVFVLVLVAVGIAWIPIVQNSQSSQLFHYINSISCYFAPPISAVYILAIFSARINEKGAFWGLMAGLTVGLIRFFCELFYTVPPCSSKLVDPRPYILSSVNYMHFAIILFVVTAAVTVAISLFTQPIDEIHLYRLTFWTRRSEKIRVDINDKLITQPEVDTDAAGIRASFSKVSGVDDDVPYGKPRTSVSLLLPPPRRSIGDETPKPIGEEAPSILDTGEPQLWKKLLYMVCGVSDSLKSHDHDVEASQSPGDDEVKLANELINEKPLWSMVCNANAIVLLISTAFIYGYFA